MKALVLDFETRDGYIKLGYGAGWVFKLHVPTTPIFKLLGYSYATLELDTGIMNDPQYSVDLSKDKLERLLEMHNNTVIMHNAPYDLGCLLTLGIDIKKLKVYDTMIMAKLYDNTLMSYSLDNLSKKYLKAEDSKAINLLVEAVRKTGDTAKTNISGINPNTQTGPDRIRKWAYENLDIVQSLDLQAVADYANQDIKATGALFNHLMKNKGLHELADYYCKFQVILTSIRAKGIKVDMDVVHAGCKKVDTIRKEVEAELARQLPGVSISSPAKLGEALKLLGFKLKKTATGQYQTDKASLEMHDSHPLIKLILRWKEIDKIGRDFFDKVRDMQMYSCPEAYEGGKYGRVFPELNLFGASATGRFSSSNPNIQQIPKGSDEFGDLCRAMFVPNDPNKTWISGDWSNQEIRLQIHYGNLINANGVKPIVAQYMKDPMFDPHQQVADLMGVTRKAAKVINLGLSYGMGSAKLSKGLGLGTVMRKDPKTGDMREVATDEGQALIDLYHSKAPYLRHLQVECINRFKNRGYVKTLGGRVLRREDPRFDYKALNKLIQGSAADQCLKALEAAWNAGLDIINIVHDEFNIEGTDKDIAKLVDIMENVVTLSIPVVAEVKTGKSWGTLTKKDITK